MSTHVEGGRPVARFRLLGFPVHVDVSFVVLVAILGWLFWSRESGGRLVAAIAIWTGVAVVAVLLHELGHALVARTTGASPHIALAGLGGLTTFTPPAPMSRARSFAVSVSGPAVGIAIGLGLLILGPGLQVAGSFWQSVLLQSAVFTTLGWSVLNLLPILPLDGGQAMRELLPGAPEVRERRAAVVSIVVAVAVAVLAFRAGQAFVALFLAFFVVQNALTLRRPPATFEQLQPVQQVVALLWRGEAARARELLEAQPPGSVDDRAVHGAVLAATGQREQGLALLEQEEARRPQDVDVVALHALALMLLGDWEALVARAEQPRGAAVPDAVLERAAQVAEAAGQEAASARIEALRR